jgi:hypothetical protein
MSNTILKKQEEAGGISGMYLPPTVLGYIASFINVYTPVSAVLLNMYKAFECFDQSGDPLAAYKHSVQNYIVYLAIAKLPGERSSIFDLTNREIMYIYDCLYCDERVIMYGEDLRANSDSANSDSADSDSADSDSADSDSADSDSAEASYLYKESDQIEPKLMHYGEHERFIDSEFMDCSEFTNNLYIPHNELEEYGLLEDMNISMYKYIRLLEEALRMKSAPLLAYIKDFLGISPNMLLYIYIKHNHPLYAPKWFSLAADDMLLKLCYEGDVLNAVIDLAIGFKRIPNVYSNTSLDNVVQPNLAAVKKIVPCFIDALDLFVTDYETGMVMPYNSWNSDVNVKEHLIVNLAGSKEIGEYLLACVSA